MGVTEKIAENRRNKAVKIIGVLKRHGLLREVSRFTEDTWKWVVELPELSDYKRKGISDETRGLVRELAAQKSVQVGQTLRGLRNSAGQVVQDGDPCEGAEYPCAGCTCKRFTTEDKAAQASKVKQWPSGTGLVAR